MQFLSYVFYSERADFISPDSRFGSWIAIAAQSGKFAFATGEPTGEAEVGDLVVAAPQTAFWRKAAQSPISYHVLQWNWAEPCDFAAGKWSLGDWARLQSNFAVLTPLSRKNDPFSRARAQTVLEDLLQLAWQTRFAPATRDVLMQKAAQLLRERAASAFSMREVSDQLGLGPVQFTRRFRAAWNQTPIQFLTSIRLEIAQKLLVETSQSLESIATQCGWANGYYLSHVFGRHFGMAPGQFRRLNRV